jgi:molybdate transport system ATP-binding protein
VVARSTELHLRVEQQGPIALRAGFSCAGGELLALLGPSGSGKSTLLRMIAGLSTPGAGRIECAGQIWFDSQAGISLSTQQRRVGYVPQDYGLFPHMTALGNVEAAVWHLPSAARRERGRSWLRKVGLAELAHRRPAELSGGERQRVALARALAREPAVLLLDEPFSSLDRATRESLYPELVELKQDLALPIVMVTHDLSEALLLADRMTLLAHGVTLQSGIPGEMLAQPANADAARLMGLRNILGGELLRHQPEAATSWIRCGQVDLACPLRADIAPGSRIQWTLPNSAVRLRGIRGRPLPESPNRTLLKVGNLLSMGEETRVSATLPGPGESIQFQVSTRLARALELATGSQVEAVLWHEALHIMAA